MSKSRVLSEFWNFLMQEKKYWLVPIVIVFILFGLLIVFSQSSAVAPFSPWPMSTKRRSSRTTTTASCATKARRSRR